MFRQWLRRDTHPDELCPWDELVPLQAAFQGQIEVLRWLQLDGWPCKLAELGAGPRHEVLDEEGPLGLPDDDYSWWLLHSLGEHALEGGRIAAVAYLVAEGIHEVSSQSCEFAARNGQQATVAWLLEHGATLSRKVACAAAGSGNVECLKWLIEEKECPVNSWAHSEADEYRNGGDAAAEEYLTSIGAHKLEREPSVVYRNGSWHPVVGFGY